MNRWTLAGLLLWRGGTLFVAAFVAYEAVHLVLQFVDVPGQLAVALALAGAGFLLVLVSLVWERIAEARTEKGALS